MGSAEQIRPGRGEEEQMATYGTKWLGIAGMAMLVMAQAARASTIYDNGGPQSNGAGEEMTGLIVADDFILGAASTITGVRFWDYEGTYHGSIEWQIYTNIIFQGIPQPDTLIASGSAVPVRVATGLLPFGEAEYQNDFGIGPVALSAGTYWLGLHNGNFTFTNPMFQDRFYWEATSLGGGSLTASFDSAPFGDGSWEHNQLQFAFLLTGTEGDAVAPAPASAWSGLVLLASIGGLRCVRRTLAGKLST
jgi:hypothetical protein